jgi:tRNA pseudouridine38-40 synthase
MNYLVTLSYDGSNFHGWAKQHNVRTVQEEIEKILQKIFNQPVPIHGSGRTDAYVHAIEQAFSFNVKKSKIQPHALLKGLRNLSPDDVYFIKVKVNEGMFHARFNAKNKTYQYVINNGKFNLFQNKYELFYPYQINLPLLKKGAKLLLHAHDFKSFSTSDLEDTIRTINYIKFKKNKNYLYITINGNGFLRNMVRMIVGSLLDLNETKKTLNTFKELLDRPKKGAAVTKAKAGGLYLLKVNY